MTLIVPLVLAFLSFELVSYFSCASPVVGMVFRLAEHLRLGMFVSVSSPFVVLIF